MPPSDLSLSELLFQACDAYLDASACKRCTASIFHKPPTDGTEWFDYDFREDFKQSYDIGQDGFQRNMKIRRKDATPSLAHMIFPALDTSCTSEDRNETVRESAEIGDQEIFRANRIGCSTRESEYAEFYKLCRCTAWSQDSDQSGYNADSIAPNVDLAESKVQEIHWENVVTDCPNLDGQLMIE